MVLCKAKGQSLLFKVKQFIVVFIARSISINKSWHCSPANPAAFQAVPVSAEHSAAIYKQATLANSRLLQPRTKCSLCGRRKLLNQKIQHMVVAQLVEHVPRDLMDSMTRGSNPVRSTRKFVRIFPSQNVVLTRCHSVSVNCHCAPPPCEFIIRTRLELVKLGMNCHLPN